MTPALQIENLHYSYHGNFKLRPTPTIKGVSLSVRKGECFGFLGRNGAGKTTTIKCILSLVAPDSGRILVNGLESSLPQARANVGYVPEQPYFYDNLTVTEMLQFYATLSGVARSERTDAIASALERASLLPHSKKRIRALSKGLTQRVALAQAIVHSPQLLILDEPFSGLDPLSRQDFQAIFLELKNSGTTLFVSSHILSDIESLCDRAGILVQGEMASIIDLSEVEPRGYRLTASGEEAQLQEILHTARTTEGLTVSKGEKTIEVIGMHRDPIDPILTRVIDSPALRLEHFQVERTSLDDIFAELNKDVAE